MKTLRVFAEKTRLFPLLFWRPKMPTALARLKTSIIAMSEMCEYSVTTAMTGLLDNNAEIVAGVKEYDDEIDEMELEIDRQCRELLLGDRLDPTAVNFVLSAHKTNNDLERIGDNAVQIAEHVLYLVHEKSILNRLVNFPLLLEQVGEIIRESVTALVDGDVKLAWKIADEQAITHDFMRKILHEISEAVRRRPETVERAMHILFIAQALKRIADLAVNIAEEVIFIAENKTIRHHLAAFHPSPSALDRERIAAIEAALVPIAVEPSPLDSARSDRWLSLAKRVKNRKKT
jgi:phosphate transport system protein